MQKDLFGKTRYRINLHTHTTLSDGHKTPKEAARIYKDAGYDAIAITDHWKFGEGRELEGLKILSGVEYNLPEENTRTGLFHILSVGMTDDPGIEQSTDTSVQDVIDAIHEKGGLAILAHPAWSLNLPSQILPLRDIDATEIYNSVSNVHMSRRPDSSLIVDMLGAQGRLYPLVADDDTHFYDGDECFSWIMVEADSLDQKDVVSAIRSAKFYATQGPEVHLLRENGEFTVKCSPCSQIVFFSDAVWSPRVFCGDGITEAKYKPRDFETFIRAEVTDANGKRAWTNIIKTKS